MTIPSTGTITKADIAAEVGSPFTIPSTPIRNLVGKPSGSIVAPTDFYGQTGGGYCTVSDISAFADTVAGTATMAGVAFGGVAWNRYIVCTVVWSCTVNDISTTILSASIGGVSAAALVQNANNGTSAFTNYGCAIIRAQVPTGTTGTVVVSFSNGTARRCYISAYRVTGWQTGVANTATAYDESVGAGSVNAASSVSVAANSAVFVVGIHSSAGTLLGLTFTGATERADSVGAFQDRIGHAMSFPIGAGARTVGVAASSDVTNRIRMCAAAFQLF